MHRTLLLNLLDGKTEGKVVKNELENGYQEFLNYLESEKNASTSTITSYKTDFGIFTHFLALTGTEPTFHTMGTPLIRRYISYLKQDKKFATSTLRRKIHSLSSFFKFLIEQEYIEKNPMLAIHAPKKEQKLPVYLKENEIKRLVEAPREYARFDTHQLRDKVMIELLVYTGARKSEVLALDWDDIDFGKKTIHIRKGKGKKERIVPLIEPLYTDMWEYLQSRLPLSNRAVLLSDKGNRLSTSNFQMPV